MNSHDAFMALDDKGKCLEMWNYLAENKKALSKNDFFLVYHHKVLPRHNCYACEVGKYRTGEEGPRSRSRCDCPIEWYEGSKGLETACEDWHSPYHAYSEYCWTSKHEKRQAAAKKVLFCIEETWNDDYVGRTPRKK